MSKKTYCFDPLKHGFEPITKYPELSFNFPMIEGYYVKIVCYSYCGNLIYWYKIISTRVGLLSDDRVEILSGSYNFGSPCEYEKQTTPRTVYLGLISNDKFAETLLKHLLGTTDNNSLENDSIQRYNQNIGETMRLEFPQHYNI